ncbi:MAG: hypothetical protein OEY97_00595 [Nitrospirota bacterium]|nr:hypothetical protein [Nitrospirota bacterium]
MKYPGWIIFLLGACSFLLNQVDHEIASLMWVDHWGTGIGNGIRAVFVIVGGTMVFLAHRKQKAASPAVKSAAQDGDMDPVPSAEG